MTFSTIEKREFILAMQSMIAIEGSHPSKKRIFDSVYKVLDVDYSEVYKYRDLETLVTEGLVKKYIKVLVDGKAQLVEMPVIEIIFIDEILAKFLSTEDNGQ